jgi:hypothetical protein
MSVFGPACPCSSLGSFRKLWFREVRCRKEGCTANPSQSKVFVVHSMFALLFSVALTEYLVQKKRLI